MHTLSRLLFALSLLFGLSAAHAQVLKVLTTGAFKQVVLGIAPAFEAQSGIKVEVLNDTAGALLKRIEAGETFDVLFLTPAGLNTLSAKGKVDAASVKPVAKVGIGLAVRTGSPHPKIATVEQFRTAVLEARSVAYIDPASGGSSGIYLTGLFQRLGMTDAIRAKAVLVQGGLVAEKTAKGEAELSIHQISEILPVAGVDLVGPLPDAIQNYTTYGYALSTATRMSAPATAFVSMFNTSTAADLIQSKGMLPIR